jgi:hypothetical protein
MAALEISFNCLCVFVPEPDKNTVHVLMPATQGHGGQHGSTLHVVRLLHRNLALQGGVALEKWALVLGPDVGTADTTLEPQEPPAHDAEMVNLSTISHKQLDRTLITDPDPRIAARVTLRAGKLLRIKSLAKWHLNGKKVFMAHEATWRIDDLPGGPLEWIPLDQPGTPPPTPPLQFLSQLSADGDGVYRISLFHVSEEALPPNTGTLNIDKVKAHFRLFYALFPHEPSDSELPHRDDGLPSFGFNCPTAQAVLKPLQEASRAPEPEEHHPDVAAS